MKKNIDMVAFLQYTYTVSERSSCGALLTRASRLLLTKTR